MSDTEEAFIGLCRLVGLHPQMDDDLDVFEASADKITKLKSQLEEARAALKPFVEEFEARRDAYIRRYPRNQSVGASNFDSMPGEWPMEGSVFSMRVFRQARSVLYAHKEGGKS